MRFKNNLFKKRRLKLAYWFVAPHLWKYARRPLAVFRPLGLPPLGWQTVHSFINHRRQRL